MKSGWEMATLGEVCHVYQPQTLAQKALREGPYPVFGANGQIGWHSEFNHENEELVLGCRGSVGSVHVTPRKTWINGNAMVVRPKDSRISIELLKYAFLGGIKISDAISGTAQPQITRTSLSPLTICFPTAKAEQYKLTKKLDDAFTGLAKAKENAEKNLQNAYALFESHLQSVFTKRGPGWVEKTIGETCALKSGTTVSPKLEKPIGETPYLKVADMTIEGNEDQITTSSRFLSDADVMENAIIPKGATIFPKRGGAILTNKKRITAVPICADLNIMAVIPSPQITPRLLYLYFLNVDMRKLGTGSSIPQINNYDVSPLAITFPTSLATQAQIERKLSQLREETQRLARIYAEKLAAFESLKASILHEAFSGNL